MSYSRGIPVLLSGMYLIFSSSSAFADIIYVKNDATGLDNGFSWGNAYTNLQTALTAATDYNEIWVASGTYIPGAERTSTFQMKENVSMYGGFKGTESIRNERNWINNVTILSGDVIGNDIGFSNNTDNVYHVVKGANNALIDGFVIRSGNANGTSPNDQGAGLLNGSSSPVVRNCLFCFNLAVGSGGGVCNDSSSAPLENCVFDCNCATWGGGVFSSYSTSAIKNCIFSGNTASNVGAGLRLSTCSVALQNCLFSGNAVSGVSGNGGGMFNSASTTSLIQNCTFAGNYADYGGGIYNSGASSISIIQNSIIWINRSLPVSFGGAELYNNSSTSTVSFCNIHGGWDGSYIYNTAGGATINAGGNMATNPLFVTDRSGTWTKNAVFNTNKFQSVLVDTSASWPENVFSNAFVQPDTNCALHYMIAANSATSLVVWGDFSTNIINGRDYRIYDYHLQKRSPCVDAGTDIVGVGNDLDGIIRPQNGDNSGGAKWDIGVYEYKAPMATVLIIR